jgi:hypothetical protein
MSTETGKVVVNRAMSVDGFIAGPDHTMDWISDFWTADAFPEVMAATVEPASEVGSAIGRMRRLLNQTNVRLIRQLHRTLRPDG